MINICFVIIPKVLLAIISVIALVWLLYYAYKKFIAQEYYLLSGFLLFWLLGLAICLIVAAWAAYYNFKELSAGIIGAMGAIFTSAIFTLPQEIKKYKILSGIDKKRKIYQDLILIVENTNSSLSIKQFGAPFVNQASTPEEYFQVLKIIDTIQKTRNNSLYISDPVIQILDSVIACLKEFYITSSDWSKIDAKSLEENMQPTLKRIQNLLRQLRKQARLETID